MENILLGAILLVLLAVVSVSVLFLIRIRAEYIGLVEQFRTYVSPESDGQPSPLARTLELTADMMARSLVAQAKTFLMAQQSVGVRQANATADAANPMSAMIPRSLRRNPLAALATQFLASKLGGLSTGNNGLTTQSSSPKFKL